MVESLKNLSSICQKPHWKEVGNWMVRRIERPLALIFTWAFLHTPITANQVTALSILCGLLGGFCLFFSNPFLFLLGIFLFHFWYLLDHVDGQIARYRKSQCLSGTYLDYLSHYLVHAAFFLGLGLQAYFLHFNIFFLLFALLSGVGSILLGVFYDTRYKAMFHQLTQVKTAEWIGFQDPLEKLKVKKEEKTTLKKRLFSWVYKTTEIHVALNIVTVTAILNLKWSHLFFMPWSYWLTLYYGIVFPAVFILRSFDHIRNRKIEAEFQSLFKVS
jgi:phosphatidylglycerophosphate synthase